MNVTRWQPFGTTWAEMNRLRDEMKRVLDRFTTGERSGVAQPAYPAIDMWQDGSHLYVEAELPGMDLQDLEILVTGDNRLSIKGERKAPQVERGVWHRREREHGHFSRLIDLPYPVAADKVEAEFNQGVLLVMLPKMEQAKPRKIQVKVQ